MSVQFPKVDSIVNSYYDNELGKSNEPITVAGLLDHSKLFLGAEYEGPEPDWTLEKIFDRLEDNSPRIAIIGGSSDHPAHIMDYKTVAHAAIRIWQNGGLPFHFSTPVMCDGTAQNNIGMSYSLQSRNAVTQMIVNQMESHSYHGAFIIQSCDKQPLAVVSAMAQLDRLRQSRGEASVFATFAPSHVLKGGTIPEDLVEELNDVIAKAESAGASDIANDLRDAMSYVLVCSTNTSFQGVLIRAVERGLITEEQHKNYEKRLSVSTCDPKGGVCAFNGSGNTSRHLVAGLGLVHPAVELLTSPPNQEKINQVVDSLAVMINNPVFSVSNIMASNIVNAIRIHSSSGGSTNSMMHMVAAMLNGGYKFSLWDLDAIHHSYPIPDLFNYSLTEGRDIFALATHCCSGDIRGIETLFYELMNNGVPMDADAPTVTGTSWRERLADTQQLSADHVKDNPVILSKPRRPFSGVDVLKGNFFESAVVKISGMPTHQLDEFDKKAAFVLYYQNELEANDGLLNTNLLTEIREKRVFAHDDMLALLKANAPDQYDSMKDNDYDSLFNNMVDTNILKIAIIISGQGPEAFGMPEMFTPMQHLNANRKLQKIAAIISDGRYSGVSYGAAIGHMTPEAINGGGILYLKSGDLLYLNLRGREIQFIDKATLGSGDLQADFEQIRQLRAELAAERLTAIRKRQRKVAATNRMINHTDAAQGVVPAIVAEEAELDYKKDILPYQQ